MRCISLANVWHISPKEAIREVHESSIFFKGSKAIISLWIGTTITHYRTETVFRMERLDNSASQQLLRNGMVHRKRKNAITKKEHTHVEQNHSELKNLTNFGNKTETSRGTTPFAVDHLHARPRLCPSVLAGCPVPTVSGTQVNHRLFVSSQ